MLQPSSSKSTIGFQCGGIGFQMHLGSPGVHVQHMRGYCFYLCVCQTQLTYWFGALRRFEPPSRSQTAQDSPHQYSSVLISTHQHTSVHISAHQHTSVHIGTHQYTSVHIAHMSSHQYTSVRISTHEYTSVKVTNIRTHQLISVVHISTHQYKTESTQVLIFT